MAGTLASRRRRERPESRLGATIAGRYRLERVLGAGGMGVVFDATHVVLERAVALKVVPAALLGDNTIAALLLAEARTTARIAHPNLVQVFDAGIDDDTGEVFLALEKLVGEDLRSMLRRRGRLPVREAIAVLTPVMDALATAHAAGTVHRDVKPENILVARTTEGNLRPTLIDFGIARVLARGPRDGADASGEAVLGTPAYMSPEQIRDPWTADERADLWSIAVVLYESIAGRAPFRASNRAALFATIEGGEFPRLRDLADGVPPALEAAIRRALDRDPARRFQSMGALREAVTRAADAFSRTRRRVTVAILVASATVALVAAQPSPRAPRAIPAAPSVLHTDARPLTAPGPSPASPPTAVASPPTPHLAADDRPVRVVRPSQRQRSLAPTTSPPPERPWFVPRPGTLQARQ